MSAAPGGADDPLDARHRIARRIAADIEDGWCVNLGIGLPILATRYVADDVRPLFHSEHGLLGMGPPPAPGAEDPDLFDAGKDYATLVPGAATFDSSLSFAMVRGGHLDLALLGGLQVSAAGDLANWLVPGRQPGVGGAMDLVHGARRVWVAMTLTTRTGGPKLVPRCSFPVTGLGVVDRLYTDKAIFEFRDGATVVRELMDGVGRSELAELTDVDLVFEGTTT